ncbi:MAG: RagB/SusD family nutrient uptake outer membrane protein [Dysgonamonadaceae bacterium]|jgi:hypothetical protein|nr:RagB/SusD family nutrient uptake outer membrane protein [Dysgonamonadaceae bacterium]
MKFKYTKIFLSCTLVALLMLGSCTDFLTEKPKSQKSETQFWVNETDARMAINMLYASGVPALHASTGWSPKATMYGGLWSGLFVDKRRDRNFSNAVIAGTFNIQMFDAEAQTIWGYFYQGIARSNAAIVNIPNMTGALTTDQINSFVAQAKFFRAYNYFYLVKEFGDVPYIDFPYTSPNNMHIPRTPSAEIYGHIEKDLLDAITVLPNTAFYANGGRITRPMAQALLARVYLQWAGYPVNGGNAVYVKAAAMAQQVINGGQHALIDPTGTTADLNSAFNRIKTAKAGTPGAIEIIYAREYNQTLNLGNTYSVHSIEDPARNASQGFLRPAGDVQYLGYLPAPMLISSYHVDDIRGMEKQFFFRYLNYIPQTGANAGTNQVLTMGDLGNWAWYDETQMRNGINGSYDQPNMRYAEVLLIAAEALVRSGGDVATAQGYLNQVRTRAGLSSITLVGDALVQAILTERLHEMPLEFRVWDDIRRTRLYPEADGINSGTLKWTPLAQASIQNKPEEGVATVGVIPVFSLLWPIPLSEMSSNPALVGNQNPGWN